HAHKCILIDKPFNAGADGRIVPLFVTVITGSVIARQQKAERVVTVLAGKLRSDVGIDNRARVHRPDRRLKYFHAFKKEWALLIKKDREALICSDDQLVGFNLGEIRIDSGIECDAAGE